VCDPGADSGRRDAEHLRLAEELGACWKQTATPLALVNLDVQRAGAYDRGGK